MDNATASTDLPDSLVILKAALEARKLIVRWDRLTPQHIEAIEAAIALHGDERLVHAAQQAYRADRPAAFAQAWVGVWQSLPGPGTRLRVVQPRCETHGQPLKHCGCDVTPLTEEKHA
ncbi:hypothetical protein [Kineococcus radiotolerans]|uniref:hypothetical protein n=1 Tax=Kineococcus radiotolerans TaxID=131568 RepID=UPI00003A4125|nr:hypothetical protein [Kineococcus radiotolerans]